MTMLILFLVLMALPFFGSAALGKRTEATLSLSFFAVVVLLYLFGIFGALMAGFWAALTLAVLCYAGGLAVMIRKRSGKAFCHAFFTPVFWVWVIVFILVWFVDRGKLVHFYDEFTHWGDVVWVMTSYDKLATQAQARSLFSTYPPAMALVQYFVQKIHLLLNGAGAYREDLLYMAAQWFMLSLYLPFLSRLSFRKPWRIVLAAAAVFMQPLFVFRTSAYALIYIDAFLAALSGFVLIYAFMCDERRTEEMLTLALALMTLVLTKDVGSLFAAGGVVVFAAGCCVRRGGLRRLDRRGTALILAMAGFVLLSWGSWKLHIAFSGAQGAQASFRQPVDLRELLAIAKGTSAHPWRRQVLNRYINQFFIPIFYLWPTNGTVTHACLILLTGGGLAWLSNVMAKKQAEWGKHFRWVCISWGALTAVYIAGMGILYLFKYNYEEAMVLSAWNRYMDTLVAYGFFAFAAGCMLAMKERLMSSNAVIAVITLMLAFCPWAGVVDTLSGSEVETSHAMQQGWIVLAGEMQEISEKDGLGEEARIYLVYDAGDTQPFLSMRYRLRPMQVNDESWALGQYNADPPAEKAVVPEDEMREKLTAEYDYLILCSGVDDFASMYGGMFETDKSIRQGGIYRIQKTDGGLQLCN